MSPKATAAPEPSRTDTDYLGVDSFGVGTESVFLNLGILAATTHTCGGLQLPDVLPLPGEALGILSATTNTPLAGEHDLVLGLDEWPLRTPAGVEPSWGEKWKSEIERARAILDLQEDWDGEGAMPYARETFDRAVSFADGLLRTIGQRTTAVIIPVIGPGPDGSIDLHWKTRDLELLVNISADPRSTASYYGDNYGDFSFEGKLNPNEPNAVIALWLSNPREVAA